MPKYQKTLSERNQATFKKPKTNLKIDYGFPVFMVSWDPIKYMIFASYALNTILIIVSKCLLYAALKISTNIAEFINMITTHDGSALAACLFVVGILCLINSALLIYAIRKSCKKSKDEHLNQMFFIFIMISFAISIIVIALGIFTCIQEATLDNRIHDGIIEGMQKYKSDCSIKMKIDKLQLNFQCCGSTGFNDWFNIKWYESPSLSCVDNDCKDDTPFSCCSMHSEYPCIHHDIMSVGTSYLYAPESNLSISEYGCMPILTCYTKLVTSRTALCFFIIGLLLLVITCLARFIQSAHMEFYKFYRNCHWHTSWLIGRYTPNSAKKSKKPPKPPPFP